MEDSTSILDLPSTPNNSGELVQNDPIQNKNTTYSPIIEPKYMNQIINGIQQGHSTIGELPSRDIPMNTLEIQQDNLIKANYVPKDNLYDNYVEEYEKRKRDPNLTEKNNKSSENKNKIFIFEEYYISFLASLLFFIFQMPVFTHLMYKYLKILHSSEGVLSNIGILFKTLLFGFILHFLLYILDIDT